MFSLKKNNYYGVHDPQPIVFILEYHLDFCRGNIVKYLMRHPYKGQQNTDLQKAFAYVQIILREVRARLEDKNPYQPLESEKKEIESIIARLDKYVELSPEIKKMIAYVCAGTIYDLYFNVEIPLQKYLKENCQ